MSTSAISNCTINNIILNLTLFIVSHDNEPRTKMSKSIQIENICYFGIGYLLRLYKTLTEKGGRHTIVTVHCRL